MPLILTPGQFSQRSDFYQQLGQLTGAGLTLMVALEQLRRNPPGPSYRHPIEQLLHQLSSGCSFTEAVQSLGSWLPAFDIALIQAGEQSGRLEACFRLLSDYYRDRARITRQMLADLAYPVFLIHFAVLIFGFLRWIRSTSLVAPFVQTFGLLVPLYGVVFLIVYAAQSRHGERWRSIMESVLHPLPVLGAARRHLALARLSAALEALLSAGVSIVEAWELAGTASGSPALKRTVLAWRPLVDAGQTPAEVVRASGVFPELFSNQYTTGEVSGKLDETLRRLQQYYQDDGSRKLHAIAQWVPRAVYLAVLIIVGYYIVQFYVGYFQQIGNAGGF
jgi:type IV pilus assembly protein PilC